MNKTRQEKQKKQKPAKIPHVPRSRKTANISYPKKRFLSAGGYKALRTNVNFTPTTGFVRCGRAHLFRPAFFPLYVSLFVVRHPSRPVVLLPGKSDNKKRHNM